MTDGDKEEECICLSEVRQLGVMERYDASEHIKGSSKKVKNIDEMRDENKDREYTILIVIVYSNSKTLGILQYMIRRNENNN